MIMVDEKDIIEKIPDVDGTERLVEAKITNMRLEELIRRFERIARALEAKI